MARRSPVSGPRDATANGQREDLFRGLIEQAADGICIIEPDGSFAVVNAALCDLFGYSRDELLRLTAADTYDPADPITVEQRIAALRPGCTLRYERLALRKDGTLVPVEVNATVISGGRLQSIVRDITVRKEAESSLRAEALERATAQEALARQERLLRQVIDADPNMIFVKDWDGKFILVNRALAEIYQTTPDEIVGKSDADFNENADEVAHFLRDDREVMASGKPKLIPEEPVTDARTHEQRWFQTIKVPLSSPDGTSRQMLGVATEITHRRSLEAQLLQAQKMEAVGRLAGGVAHDFNNLLTIIMCSAELMARDLGKDDPQREDLDQIADSASRAASLTKQLLAFSRQQVIEPRPINVNTIVTGISKMFLRLIGEDITFAAVLQPELRTIRADPGQLEQVLLNLAVNARDAMPTGGHLTIETQNVDLDADYSTVHAGMNPGPHVMIAVSDSGVGMDEATKARIFEPFFTTKELGKGTGLGLASVYGIVRQSGGFIWVYSEPGKGATFKLYFPAIDGLGDQSVEPPALTMSRGGETILLVEDDAAVRTLTRRVLKQGGYRVLEAADPAAAISLVHGCADPIDLLVTDVVMPGIGGRALAALLTAARPGTRVLFISGYTDDAIVRHGRLEPGTEFMQKPFTPAGLLRRVREVLDRRASPVRP